MSFWTFFSVVLLLLDPDLCILPDVLLHVVIFVLNL